MDPAPGDLARVDASAEQYREVASNLGSALDAINAIVNQAGIWEGEASEAFARRVDDLPKYLDSASRSTSKAATVLADWSESLTVMQRNAADHIGLIAQVLADNRARLFGRFATRENTEQEPVTATVVLAMPELDTDGTDVSRVARNGNLVAAELERQYRQRHPKADVRVVELSAGPAMAAASAGEYRLPPEVTGQVQTVVRPEFKAEFQLPTPDGKRLVIMAVTTDSEAGWPAVAADAMRIANSIRFEESPTEGAESE